MTKYKIDKIYLKLDNILVELYRHLRKQKLTHNQAVRDVKSAVSDHFKIYY